MLLQGPKRLFLSKTITQNITLSKYLTQKYRSGSPLCLCAKLCVKCPLDYSYIRISDDILIEAKRQKVLFFPDHLHLKNIHEIRISVGILQGKEDHLALANVQAMFHLWEQMKFKKNITPKNFTRLILVSKV